MEMEMVYQTYKPMLLSIAYRMLGSVSDAEDMVQDLFTSLQSLDTKYIVNLKSYIVKMMVNRCLNFLKSSRKQRELYIGPWLPEPQIIAVEQNPLESVVQEESVTYALLVLIQELSPMERAVFILREVLGYEYDEVAEILDKTEVNCRKIYSRAKVKIKPDTMIRPDPIRDTGPLVQSFLSSVVTGDFQEFVRLLTEDAVLITDAGGKRRAALKPIFGKKRIQAFFEGIAVKGSINGHWLTSVINGQSGLLLIKEPTPEIAICFAMDGEHLQAGKIFVIRNPDKLKHLSYSRMSQTSV
jgi:RNA polymerase sigma-70 factor, ECF subfamily